MLVDHLENEHIKCKITRHNKEIELQATIKEIIKDNNIHYYAANTPDYLLNFNGSGLPFPNKEFAFEGSPNIGSIITNDNTINIKLLTPNSYYDENYVLKEPEVIIKYNLLDNKVRILNIPIDNKIPYRNLFQNKKDDKFQRKIQTQEKNFLLNSYPKIFY
tara:strand:+ start:1261 stop:1743 length:483 start_codon:yes stop_codon:yes gene_type:complete